MRLLRSYAGTHTELSSNVSFAHHAYLTKHPRHQTDDEAQRDTRSYLWRREMCTH